MNKKLLITLFISIIAISGITYMIVTGRFLDQTPTEIPEEVTEVETDYAPEAYEVIGHSVENRDIRAFSFGSGEDSLVFVGAMHGGYEWNSALLSYELIDYFIANPDTIPENIKVVVIPVANPDGLFKVLGSSSRFEVEDAPHFDYADEISFSDDFVTGRFNAHNVDLNRNFDCKWKESAIWRDYEVSGGSAPFSEPETTAIRDYITRISPKAAVFFHSASNGVYTSFCEGDPLENTNALLKAYSGGSGYTGYNDYTYYEVTGDAGDWLSTIGIPAITVELSTHQVSEFEKNLAGIEAMFQLYSSNSE